MIGSTSPTPDEGPSRAEWRRLQQRNIEARQRWLDERDAVLEASLEPGERVVAQRHGHPLVTDQRILQARQLHLPPRRGEWVIDPVPYDEITRWSSGTQHDGRPILKLEHRPLTRIDRVPAKRFLWFRWGDAEGPLILTTTSYGFGRSSNSILAALRAELARRELPQGTPFVIRPAGTREERTKDSRGELSKASGTASIKFRVWRLTEVVYRGKPAWPLRITSWILFTVPAWFVAPWLVVPAVIAAELAWIAAMRWMWLRTRSRAEDQRPP